MTTVKTFEWTRQKLWDLRREIVLNSLFTSDYTNSFGVNALTCSYFFDGYLDYLTELRTEDGIDSDDFDALQTTYSAGTIALMMNPCPSRKNQTQSHGKTDSTKYKLQKGM